MFPAQKQPLIVAAAALLLGAMPGCSRTLDKPDKPGDAFVIAVERSGGMVATKDPFYAYHFTMTRDGNWKFSPRVAGKPREGKVAANDVENWLKEIEEGGFDKLTSHPKLGQTDAPFMDIIVETAGGKEQKRIALRENLSKAIDKKVIEFVEPGK